MVDDVAIQMRFDDLETQIQDIRLEMKENVDRLYTDVDGLALKVKTAFEEIAFLMSRQQRLEERVDNI